MRTKLNIDDVFYNQPDELAGVHQETALLRKRLKALIERERARWLTLLGGSELDHEQIPRRHSGLEG